MMRIAGTDAGRECCIACCAATSPSAASALRWPPACSCSCTCPCPFRAQGIQHAPPPAPVHPSLSWAPCAGAPSGAAGAAAGTPADAVRLPQLPGSQVTPLLLACSDGLTVPLPIGAPGAPNPSPPGTTQPGPGAAPVAADAAPAAAATRAADEAAAMQAASTAPFALPWSASVAPCGAQGCSSPLACSSIRDASCCSTGAPPRQVCGGSCHELPGSVAEAPTGARHWGVAANWQVCGSPSTLLELRQAVWLSSKRLARAVVLPKACTAVARDSRCSGLLPTCESFCSGCCQLWREALPSPRCNGCPSDKYAFVDAPSVMLPKCVVCLAGACSLAFWLPLRSWCLPAAPLPSPWSAPDSSLPDSSMSYAHCPPAPAAGL
jgi:hypothetical protein